MTGGGWDTALGVSMMNGTNTTDSLTYGTTHMCGSWCNHWSWWEPTPVTTTIHWSYPPMHEHDFERVEAERLLFCRKCGETKALAKKATL